MVLLKKNFANLLAKTIPKRFQRTPRLEKLFHYLQALSGTSGKTGATMTPVGYNLITKCAEDLYADFHSPEDRYKTIANRQENILLLHKFVEIDDYKICTNDAEEDKDEKA